MLRNLPAILILIFFTLQGCTHRHAGDRVAHWGSVLEISGRHDINRSSWVFPADTQIFVSTISSYPIPIAAELAASLRKEFHFVEFSENPLSADQAVEVARSVGAQVLAIPKLSGDNHDGDVEILYVTLLHASTGEAIERSAITDDTGLISWGGDASRRQSLMDSYARSLVTSTLSTPESY